MYAGFTLGKIKLFKSNVKISLHFLLCTEMAKKDIERLSESEWEIEIESILCLDGMRCDDLDASETRISGLSAAQHMAALNANGSGEHFSLENLFLVHSIHKAESSLTDWGVQTTHSIWNERTLAKWVLSLNLHRKQLTGWLMVWERCTRRRRQRQRHENDFRSVCVCVLCTLYTSNLFFANRFILKTKVSNENQQFFSSHHVHSRIFLLLDSRRFFLFSLF